MLHDAISLTRLRRHRSFNLSPHQPTTANIPPSPITKILQSQHTHNVIHSPHHFSCRRPPHIHDFTAPSKLNYHRSCDSSQKASRCVPWRVFLSSPIPSLQRVKLIASEQDLWFPLWCCRSRQHFILLCLRGIQGRE